MLIPELSSSKTKESELTSELVDDVLSLLLLEDEDSLELVDVLVEESSSSSGILIALVEVLVVDSEELELSSSSSLDSRWAVL